MTSHGHFLRQMKLREQIRYVRQGSKIVATKYAEIQETSHRRLCRVSHRKDGKRNSGNPLQKWTCLSGVLHMIRADSSDAPVDSEEGENGPRPFFRAAQRERSTA